MAESNEQNAIGVYLVAAAYHHNVELNQIDNPGIANVGEVEPDVYRILSNREETDELVLAECTYHEDTDEWTVELNPSDPTGEEGDFLIVTWDETAEQYVVMGEEE